jgi:hypothetical protein
VDENDMSPTALIIDNKNRELTSLKEATWPRPRQLSTPKVCNGDMSASARRCSNVTAPSGATCTATTIPNVTSFLSGSAAKATIWLPATPKRSYDGERVMSGFARAKAEGITLGRRALEKSEPEKIEAIKAALAAGMGIRRVARENKAGVGTVLRVKAEMAA